MKDENKEAMLPVNELRKCSRGELQQIVVDSKEAIFAMRQQNAAFGRKWPMSKPHLLKAYRKQIARCKTVLSECSYRG